MTTLLPYPQRIQRKRERGWRAPPNVVSVCRPGRFGNPWRVKFDPTCLMWEVRSPTGGVIGMFESRADAHKTAVEQFAVNLPAAELAAARELLAGRNIMCWCPAPPPGIPDREWCHSGWLLDNVPLLRLRCEAA